MIQRPPSYTRTGLFLAAIAGGMLLMAALYHYFSR
jgi:hypothetical protein